MRREHGNSPSDKNKREALANCSLDVETFRGIVEGRNPCLTLQELREIADIACNLRGQGLNERSSALLKRFKEHVEQGKCPDCSEFYEAVLITLNGAARAMERIIKSA